jgi:hypothetical protein
MLDFEISTDATKIYRRCGTCILKKDLSARYIYSLVLYIFYYIFIELKILMIYITTTFHQNFTKITIHTYSMQYAYM